MTQSAKIQCIHPEGKHAPAIAVDTYTLFEKAIYHALKGKKQGLTFTQLTDEVAKCFKQQKIKFPGSIGWYAVTVKNHMESTGAIKTAMVKGTKMHTLA